MRSGLPTLYVLLLSLIVSLRVKADSASQYGMGGTGTARVGSLTAEASNPWAAFYNPALLARLYAQQMAVSSAVGKTSFDRFESIRVQGGRYRTAGRQSDRFEKYQLPDATLEEWSVSWSYPFSLSPLSKRQAGLGFCLSGPFTRVRQLSADTPDAFQPLRYGPQDKQLRAVVSGGVEIIPEQLYLGAGFSFYLNAVGNGEALLLADNPAGRLQMDVSLNSHAVVGVFVQQKQHSMGFVFRQGINPTFTQRLSGRVELGDGIESLDLPFLMQATLYGEPHRLEADWQYKWDGGTISVGAVYALWKTYEPPFLNVRSVLRGGREVGTDVPEMAFHNTFSPRVSLSTQLWGGPWRVLWGYRFEPSPVPDTQLRGVANLVDSATHVVGAGLTYSWLRAQAPVEIGLHGQMRFLHSRTVTKEDGQAVGAPGYTLGGRGYYLGLSLSAPL